jgi:DNA topoisomerase IA
LLEEHNGTHGDPGFTASMEEWLYEIACGEEGADWVAYLDEFYAGDGDNGLAAKVKCIDETKIALFVGLWGLYLYV